MRTIKELREKFDGKLYIFCKNKEIENRFLIDAENEGFRFGTQKPTENHASNIIAVENDLQLSHVGTIGRMAYQCGQCVRVDYDKFICGQDYII